MCRRGGRSGSSMETTSRWVTYTELIRKEQQAIPAESVRWTLRHGVSSAADSNARMPVYPGHRSRLAVPLSVEDALPPRPEGVRLSPSTEREGMKGSHDDPGGGRSWDA